MNLKKIQAFVLVIQKGSFSEAADFLGLTQPAVSSQIKGLENELGIRLLDRFSAKVEPTAAGRYVYEIGLELTSKWEEMLEGVQRFHHTLTGTLRVGASTIPGTYLLPRWIGGFHQHFPQLKIENQISDSTEIRNRLVDRKLDVAVTGEGETYPLLITEPVATDSLVFIAPRDHELGTTFSQVEPRALVSHSFVLREEGSGTRRSMETAMQTAGMDIGEIQTVAHFGSTEAIIAAVESGLGISYVSKWAAQQAVQANRIQIIPTQEEFHQTYYVSYLKTQSDVPKVKEFVKFVKSVGRSF